MEPVKRYGEWFNNHYMGTNKITGEKVIPTNQHDTISRIAVNEW